jgi:formate transporter
MDRIKKGTPSSPSSGRSMKGYRPSQGSLLQEAYLNGSRRLTKISGYEVFFLAIWGGAFMTVAALLSVLLTMEIAISGVQYILMALGLSVGLVFIILTNSVLFTEPNIYVPGNFYNSTICDSFLRLFWFWGIAWIGNIIGAIIVSFLVYLSQIYSNLFTDTLLGITATKYAHVRNFKFHGTGELLVSGMLSNWIIALASFFAMASRNLINQFIIIFLAFLVIVAANFQFFPANIGYFALNVLMGRSIGIVDLFAMNLIPVSIGNILGAAILVGWPLLYLSKRRAPAPQA